VGMLRIRLCRYWWSRPKRTRHANQIRSADSDRRALIKFMTAVATKTCHLILGTATPYQDRGGRIVGSSEQIGDARTRTRTFAVATAGSRQAHPDGSDERRGRGAGLEPVRNPLLPRTHDELFDRMYQDLDIDAQAENFTDQSYTDLDDFTRDDLRDALRSGTHGIGFFQYHNAISRHVVLRRRKALEDTGLMKKIAIDMWPNSRPRGSSKTTPSVPARTSITRARPSRNLRRRWRDASRALASCRTCCASASVRASHPDSRLGAS
jgi:hypothetical protein